LLVLEKALGLAVMAPDGSGLTGILEGSSGGNWATHPNWSPDGKQITFAIVGVGIFVIDLDGTNKRMVVEDRGAGKPDWSPDGRQLVFVSDRHGPEKPKASRGGWFDPENLFIVNIASGQIRQLTNYDSINTHPDWSPDGKQIAFVSSMDDDWEIFVINVDSGYLRQLTQNKECDWDPKWSPSGDAIAFWACDKPASPSDSHIWVTDLNGTFLKLTHDEARNKSPAWSPEGDRLAYTVSGGSIAVWNSGTTTATGEWSDRFNWQNNGATPVLSFPVVLSSPNVTLGTR
jgi:Tol biopolymer transport system component